MARRGYDEYDREMRGGRGRDTRELQREQERLDRRDHRQTEARDPDRMDYTRDGRADLRTTRDSTRTVYSYADQNDRDDLPPRGYMEDAQDRYNRQPIELQPERREEPSARYQDYFLPGEGINREVIQYDICRYLGNDATVRPCTHPDVGCRLSTGPNPMLKLIITRAVKDSSSRLIEHPRPYVQSQECDVTSLV
jgi:hypothetical protein